MNAYYTVCDVNDPFTAAEHAERKAKYLRWIEHLPDGDANLSSATRRLSAATGMTEYKVETIILGLHRLRSLPQVRALQEELFHLDFDRIAAINMALYKADMDNPDTAAFLDSRIADFLTPKRPRQALPTRRRIERFIDEAITQIDDTVAADEELPQEPPAPYYALTLDDSQTATLSLTLDKETAAVLDSAIQAVAEKDGLSPSRALMQLVTGQATPTATIVVNTYSGPQREGKAFVPSIGWATLSMFEGKFTIRDMDSAALSVSTSYKTPQRLAAFIEGRDGYCRYPGCNKPAAKSQKDHRINYADGGPTSAENLFSLCQHHHNLKTDQQFRYFVDPYTAEVVFLFEDGSYLSTLPDGPLAPDNFNWLRTMDQVHSTRAAARREQAQRAKAAQPVVEADAEEVIPF